MKNTMLQSKILLSVMLLLFAFHITSYSKSRETKANIEQNKSFSSEILEKLYNKYNVTEEMLNIQNVNATEVVDSVVGLDLFGNKFKYMYQYDYRGNIISEISQDWDGSKLENNRRTTNEFNSDGKQTLEIRERWDGSAWVNYSKFTESYNENDNSLEELDQDWDGTQWVNSSRWISSYNSEGKKISELAEDWDGSAWIPDYRETRSSGDDGSNVYLSESWDGSAWVNDSRNTIKYNANNNFESNIEETWDGTAWVNLERTTFTYDESGRNTSVRGEIWENENWVNEYQYSYIFDANGLRTSWLFEYWNETQWENDFRYVYTYDANGSKTEELIEEWDGTSFVGTSRKTFTNNNNGNVIFAIHESWDESAWVESPTYLGFFIDIDSENSNYYSFLSTRITVHYGSITDVESDKNLSAQFVLSQNYPNPFNPSTTIEFTVPEESFVQLKVFDILGKKIVTLANEKYSAGSYKANFDAANLPSGLYIAQMKAGNFSKSFKMMLLK
ncbi:MAG: T9SS type A sorting domain-containing protein [Ignavibacteriales bacterium]|nr:T9SS type A sorting domain-containing protein [Ignavibacteriales bacterium]